MTQAAAWQVRKRLRYEELPPQLKSLIKESAFIKAYDRAEAGSIIAWTVNEVSKKQQEIEFSLGESRVLSAKERAQAFPPAEEISVPGLGFRVIKGYQLEQGTDVLYETYDVYSDDLQKKIVTCDQVYFSPMLADVADVVGPAVEAASLPASYSNWPMKEKVDFWVASLYRLRRQTGETGAHEDEIFSLSLINKMKTIDPNIYAILPLVLKGLATMESADPVELTNSFNRRTGLSI